ncbi:hypothetical protein BGZ97_003069 [Linnemannia gamsii]|jgi:hypothetical protein|uniref:Uncharacterized protein n=1 Tax=Linnemannia gamsii TaxID=64522 RepID=A0A9P6QTZ2_9FUNG|nr:hypothetical protein BGZ97_003069 [Linnemannia gamsii]
MDPSQESYDGLNTAYMNMLNRNIPGVGNNPLNTTTTKPTHLTNKTKDTTSATATTLLTQNQRHAIDTLQAAIKDAFYVSEGEEPYQTVHITTTTTTTTGATALKKTTTSFPTEQEFVTLLHATQLLPSFQQQQQQVQEDEDEGNTCEKSSNLQSILNTSNPGSDKLAKALQDVFGYCSSSSSTEANTTTTATAAATTAPKDDKMVLYRVADPSSSTKVHIWVLGWIDNDLIGLHTISIES